MGVCGSSIITFQPNTKFPGQDEQVTGILRELGFSMEDISKLYTAFVKIDKDFSGEINMEEMLSYFKLEITPLTRRLFRYFDEDGSGQLNFAEFACTVWNFLTAKNLGIICFNMADLEGKGVIRNGELKELLEIVHSLPNLESNEGMMSEFNSLKNGAEKFDSILNDSVVELTNKNPSIAGPVFAIQVKIRQALLNGKFWVDLANLRNADPKLATNDYPKLLRAHIKSVNEAVVARQKDAKIKEISSKKNQRMGTVLEMYNGDKASLERKKKEDASNKKIQRQTSMREQQEAAIEANNGEKPKGSKTLKKKPSERGTIIAEKAGDKRGSSMSGKKVVVNN